MHADHHEWAELENHLGPELDRLDRNELMRLSYAAFRGMDFPMLLVRRLGRSSRLLRPLLLRQLQRGSRA